MNSLFESIADGLAEQSFAVADNFLLPNEVQNILASNFFRNMEDGFKKAGIGRSQSLQVNEAIRGDYIQWIDRDTAAPPLTVYLNRIHDLVQFLNQALFLSLKDYEVHMTVYPVGSFYRRHLDQFRQDDHRKLSVICYLNQDWKPSDGGQLRMYLEEPRDVLPLAGRLVCFRSDKIEHEVLPASRARLSLTGWILDQYAELKHL